MRKLLAALGILALLCSPALAGQNEGGAMVMHTNPAYAFSAGTVCNTTFIPAHCADVLTTASATGPNVLWSLAAFRPGTNPAVTVVYWGVNFDPQMCCYPTSVNLCGPAGSLQAPNPDWFGSGIENTPTGNSVAFPTPVSPAAGTEVFPFYWYRYSDIVDAGAFFCTQANPAGGYAAFIDGQVPSQEDRIDNFGCVVWGAPGSVECPLQPLPGACCLVDGRCIEVFQAECEAQGGDYQGDGTLCATTQCPQPEACCFPDYSCEMLLASECATQGGVAQGAGVVCTPDLCLPLEGACCLESGECVYVTEADCIAQGGTYQGRGVQCATVQCPQPPVACCFPDGHCEDLLEAECTTQGGTPQAAGSECATTVCIPVATETRSVGSIKANYK